MKTITVKAHKRNGKVVKAYKKRVDSVNDLIAFHKKNVGKKFTWNYGDKKSTAHANKLYRAAIAYLNSKEGKRRVAASEKLSRRTEKQFRRNMG